MTCHAARRPDEPRLADFALNRPRFTEVPAREVCRGTEAERAVCRDGAGACARDVSCFD